MTAKAKSDYYHVSDGEWIEVTKRGFKEQCCDCGLVHEMEFKAFAETRQRKNGTFTIAELPWPVRVLFRARRQR